MCIRDENGCFIEEKSMWFTRVPEPQAVEAMGLLQTMKWLKDLGLEEMTIEMGCISIVKAVTKATSGKTDLGVLISHYNELLSQFLSYMISYV